jgi:16S rRNA (guanine966-N2)-methyltransferase
MQQEKPIVQAAPKQRTTGSFEDHNAKPRRTTNDPATITGRMRIVAGKYGSRTLLAPKGTQTRPTTDRVREAIFSMLQARIDLVDIEVLDLYAGTGALGLEALSRGAKHCTFVEVERSALQALAANIDALDARQSTTVKRTRVETFVQAPSSAFQLILADPPYADVHHGALRALTQLRQALGHDPTRIWLVEQASRDAHIEIAGLFAEHRRVYGDTTVTLFREVDPETNEVLQSRA